MSERRTIFAHTSQEARCLYLMFLNDDDRYVSEDRRDLQYMTFHHDREKNLLYSHNRSHRKSNYDFIYKLSDQIRICDEKYWKHNGT